MHVFRIFLLLSICACRRREMGWKSLQYDMPFVLLVFRRWVQSLKHLFSLPVWELGPGIQNFQNRKDSFLIKCFMVCFFPPCCGYLTEAGKCTCKFPFQWLFLAVKNLKGCYIYPSPTPVQKSPSSSVLAILGFRRLQDICLLTALQ